MHICCNLSRGSRYCLWLNLSSFHFSFFLLWLHFIIPSNIQFTVALNDWHAFILQFSFKIVYESVTLVFSYFIISSLELYGQKYIHSVVVKKIWTNNRFIKLNILMIVNQIDFIIISLPFESKNSSRHELLFQNIKRIMISNHQIREIFLLNMCY